MAGLGEQEALVRPERGDVPGQRPAVEAALGLSSKPNPRGPGTADLDPQATQPVDLDRLLLAEEERFELPVGCPTAVFKTAALDHSATPPKRHWSNDTNVGGPSGTGLPAGCDDGQRLDAKDLSALPG